MLVSAFFLPGNNGKSAMVVLYIQAERLCESDEPVSYQHGKFAFGHVYALAGTRTVRITRTAMSAAVKSGAYSTYGMVYMLHVQEL